MSDEVELVECVSCSTDYSPDDLATTPSGDVLCSDCRIYCERCEEYGYEEGCRSVVGVGIYCENCADNYTFWCEGCEDTYSDNESSYHLEDIGVYWCEGCCSNNANWCENCEVYNRDECENCDSSTRLINQYSYKPNPVFYGEDKNKLHFGIELEMEIRDNNLEDSASYVMEMLGDFVYLKEDSSINSGGYRGFEMVSHPATLDYFTQGKNLWATLDYLRKVHTARSWDSKSCGLHIHISRTGFKSGAHTHRFLSLIYKNSDKMMKLGGRSSHYAKFNDVYKYDEYDRPYFTLAHKVAHPSNSMTERYSAVNTQNEHTLELRFFRGTMNPSGVLSAIQLAHATVEYTRNLTLSDVKMGALSWEWFSDWIQANNGLYPELYMRMNRVDKLVINSQELVNA
jgi:hypothetical protein